MEKVGWEYLCGSGKKGNLFPKKMKERGKNRKNPKGGS